MPKSPLFIVGCPRSGTTLLRLMFDSHPQIAVPNETFIFKNLPQVPDLTMFKKKIDTFFENYARKRNKPYWGEKTPYHAKHVHDIKRLYPESTIVCMVRDPRAIVASCMRYTEEKKNGDFWIKENIDEAMELFKTHTDPVIQNKTHVEFLKYENLVARPERELQKLCKQIGLEYYNCMLNFYAAAEEKILDEPNEELPPWHKPITKAVDPGNIDKWKTELSPEEIQYIEQELTSYFAFFGYERTHTQ